MLYTFIKHYMPLYERNQLCVGLCLCVHVRMHVTCTCMYILCVYACVCVCMHVCVWVHVGGCQRCLHSVRPE